MPYSTRPRVKQRLRPQRSLSLLHGIIRIAMINKNRVIAACTPCTVVSRSAVMSLIITFMFEPAKLQMNCASASGARNRRRDAAAAALEPLVGFRASVTSAPLTPRRGGPHPGSLAGADLHPHRMRPCIADLSPLVAVRLATRRATEPWRPIGSASCGGDVVAVEHALCGAAGPDPTQEL